MAPQHSVQKWLTLTAHILATFSNALGFGIYFTNSSVFAAYYDVKPSLIEYSFFVGLLFELVFCLPAMKLVEWRLDYSLMCGAFLSMAGYFVQYTAQNNFIVGTPSAS
jgi:Flp pilus assembly protein protease CpaA